MPLYRTSAGLLLLEDFATGAGWSGAQWSSVSDPLLVAAPRSPIPNMELTLGGLDAGGVREGHLFIDDLGTVDEIWWTYYGAGNYRFSGAGAGAPWRPQIAKSLDKGLTWTKLGYTDFDLHKTSTPADGSYDARDMLVMSAQVVSGVKTYYLHAMSGFNDIEYVPFPPYESDLFSGPTPIGPWTFVRRSGVIGAPGAFNDSHFCISCTVLDPDTGIYESFYSSYSLTSHALAIGRATQATIDGAYTVIDKNWGDLSAGENPKVFYSNALGKWVNLGNGAEIQTATLSDRGRVLVGDSVTDWISTVKSCLVQRPCADDGLYRTGIMSPFYVAEGLVRESADGYIGINYDTDPYNDVPHALDGLPDNAVFGRLMYSVLEPSRYVAAYSPGSAVFSDSFGRSDRSIDGDNGWSKTSGTHTPAIVSGKLDMLNLFEDIVVVQAGISLVDVELSGAFTLGAAAGISFVFRYQDASNYYMLDFGLDTTGEMLIQLWKKTTATSYVKLAEFAYGYFPADGRTYNCKVVAIGNRFIAFLNGNQTLDATDATFSAAGAVGLRTSNQGLTTRLADNFQVFDRSSTSIDRYSYAHSNTNFIKQFVIEPLEFVTSAAWGFDYRVQSSGDSYRLKLTAGGGLTLQKSTGGSGGIPGSFSNIGSSTGSQVSVPNFAHRLRVEVTGNLHEAWFDGEKQISYTDSSSPYTSGPGIAFFGTRGRANIRRPHMRSSNSVTINGLTNGDAIVLRAPGGVPIATATVSGTSHTFTHTHYPMGSIEVNGVELEVA